MNEDQFVNLVSQMLLNTGYTKTRDALLEEAKTHGFKITKKEIPLSKDLEIREPDVIRRAKRNEDRINNNETDKQEDGEEETKKVRLSDLLIGSPDEFVKIMNFIYGTDWLSYIRWRDGDHVADVISERLNFYYEHGF